MARTFRRRDPLPALSEINVTPLIDLAFALLIIFMITAPLLEQKIELLLPVEAPKAQTPPSDQPVQGISVSADGQFFWGDTQITEDDLANRIQNLARSAPDTLIRVRGDARVPYQAVVTVLDLLKANELRNVSLDTRAE